MYAGSNLHNSASLAVKYGELAKIKKKFRNLDAIYSRDLPPKSYRLELFYLPKSKEIEFDTDRQADFEPDFNRALKMLWTFTIY